MPSHDDFTATAPAIGDKIFYRDIDDAGTGLTDGVAVCTLSQLGGLLSTAGDKVGDDDFTFYANGLLIKTSAGNYSVLRFKTNATVAPDADNDDTEYFGVGAMWIDVSADEAYICLDATTGAAVWKAIT